jgi:hypothetical protein
MVVKWVSESSESQNINPVQSDISSTLQFSSENIWKQLIPGISVLKPSNALFGNQNQGIPTRIEQTAVAVKSSAVPEWGAGWRVRGTSHYGRWSSGQEILAIWLVESQSLSARPSH